MSIVVVGTGGTIASTRTGRADADPERSASDIVSAVPSVRSTADVRTRDFSSVPGTHVTVEAMLELAELLADLDDDESVDGVVVTHGTDTLEESAYVVDLCYDGDTPVTFTGAMRKPTETGPDGPANLLASVHVVRSDLASEAVTVTFGERVYAAHDVTKMHTSCVDSFQAPEFGPLATVDDGEVAWQRTPVASEPRTYRPDPDALTTDVLALTATAEMSDTALRAGLDSDGVCIAAMGAGILVPETIVDVLEALQEADVPVVATTRCPEGRLAIGRSVLTEYGVLFSDVNLQKTRLNCIVALASGRLETAFES